MEQELLNYQRGIHRATQISHSLSSAYLNFDGQLFVGGQRIVIGKRQQADLIQSIRGIGNQLPEENLKMERQHVRR